MFQIPLPSLRRRNGLEWRRAFAVPASLILAAAVAPAGAGLVALWSFNDAGSLGINAAGGGSLAAAGGAEFSAEGHSGGALKLSGDGQYLSGSVAGLPVGNGTYTVAAWFKPDALGARGIIGWGNFGTERQVNALRLVDGGNGLSHYWWAADLTVTDLSTNLLDGKWHHVAATWDGTTRRLFLDGAAVGQDTPGVNAATADNFRIGSTNNGEFFDGLLDDVAVFDTALTTTQVGDLAAGGTPGGGTPAAPTAITVDDLTIRPENGPGDFLSSLSTTDPNPGEAHTFTLVAGEGSQENANFSIFGHQLRAAVSFAAMAWQPQRIRLRSTDSAGLWVESAFVLTVKPKTRGVVINEIHYNSQNNKIRNSFIELYNDGDTAVDLTGWRLSSGVDYRFPAGTTLAAGGYLTVGEDPATMQSYFGVTALGPWDAAVETYADGAVETGGLSNDGDTIRLRDAADVVVEEIDYGNHSPWPAEANGEGCSIERINPGLDGSHGGNWAGSKAGGNLTTDIATPGKQNNRFSATAAPAVRQVAHTPQQPKAGDPIVVTAKITDPQGVGSVSLAWQLCAPGSFIPSKLPKTISGGNFVNVTTPLAANPAFELAANWTSAPMNDDGVNGDAVGGDGIWTAVIPAQPNRTLVRYRITAADNAGASARYPLIGDPSLNFACFVYNGVPDYEGTSAATLTSLPVYHFLTRKADWDQCVAYNSAYRLVAGLSWSFENWEACFVSDGVVYDHIPYRLKGANGRYTASGTGGAGNAKRAFKFLFNKGYEFAARKENGEFYPEKWSTMITENLWENRATFTFSLNEAVNFYLFNQLGVPSPDGNWGHFRTVMQTAEQPDKWRGDFWGLMWVHEDYDRRFLKAHNLLKGNLYKLTRDATSGRDQLRYQSALGPANGTDHDWAQNNLKGTTTPTVLNANVNLALWSRYHAFCEAVRHYDYWPNGDNNAAYYFYPLYNTANGNRGQLWYLPNDLDATWGPTWNNGKDLIHNTLFNDSGESGGDSATNPTQWPVYFNQVREIRRLLWQPDQINPLIDQFAATIRPFVNADFTRWVGAPADAGNYGGLSGSNTSGQTTLNAVGQTALDNYVLGMKDFAFDANNNGSTWPGGNVSRGGRAAYLDTLGSSLGENTTKYPETPVITYSGPDGYPVTGLKFTTSAFSDPQGADTFAGIQWRVAEVNDSDVFTPGVPRLLEINASNDSGELSTFTADHTFPAASCQPGHRYRARVRMKDNTGRWSYWSTAVEFTAGTFDPTVWSSSLVISELMYHAAGPTAAETAAGAALTPPQVWNDDSFDWLELRNVGAAAIDLTGFQFTAGFDFIFPDGTMIQPGANLLVVQNIDAFKARYGSSLPIAGAWDANDKLSNGGETITLQFGQTLPPVLSFTYDDEASTNWPTSPDGDGPSLVRVNPSDTTQNASLGVNWKASATSGGTPGVTDSTGTAGYAAWKTAHGLTDDGDSDGDGLSALAEYALGADPKVSSPASQPQGSRATLTVDGTAADYFTLIFPRANAATDVTVKAEFSTDLSTWPLTGILVSATPNADGQTRTEVWRAPAPASGQTRLFGRLHITTP